MFSTVPSADAVESVESVDSAESVASVVSVVFVESVDSDVDPPQPTMDNAIAAAIIAANAFLFIFVPPVFLFGDFAEFASFPADEFIIITRVLKKNRIFFDKLLKFLVIS